MSFSAAKMLPIAKPASNREYPETMVLHFAELVLFWGLGTLHGKIVSDGEAVQAKEWVFYRFCGKFPFVFANSKLIQSANPKLIHPI
jgi:hypothetical protein